MNKLIHDAARLTDWWNALFHPNTLLSEAARLNKNLATENTILRRTIVDLENSRIALRESVIEHMDRETSLRREISSLRQHLNMVIEERDRAQFLLKQRSSRKRRS